MIVEAQAQDFSVERARMVAEVDAMYAEMRGYTGLAAMSPQVRAALGKVERHRLVPPEQRLLAYRNHPLPIGLGQTISQPYIVALSTDLIAPPPGQTVLEIGTGSGYQAAVLAEIVRKVYSIEILESLAAAAPRVPEALVAQLKVGGRMVIPVGAAGGEQHLLLLVKSAPDRIERRSILPVRFVPLVPLVPLVPPVPPVPPVPGT